MKYDLGKCISDFNNALTGFSESVNVLGIYGAKLIRKMADMLVDAFSFKTPPSNNYRKLHGMPMVRRRKKRR